MKRKSFLELVLLEDKSTMTKEERAHYEACLYHMKNAQRLSQEDEGKRD